MVAALKEAERNCGVIPLETVRSLIARATEAGHV
jgi:hypothetical protein